MTEPRWGETGPPAQDGGDSDATAQFGYFRDPDSYQGEDAGRPVDRSYRARSYDRYRQDDRGPRDNPQDTRSRRTSPRDQPYRREMAKGSGYPRADPRDQPYHRDRPGAESFDRYYGNPDLMGPGDEPRPYDLRRDRTEARRPQSRQRGQARGVSGLVGICIVAGAVLLGALVTVLTRSAGPGLVLGAFLVAGTIAAGLAVRSRAAYLLIPVPALAYLCAALIAGLIQDPAARASRTALVVAAAQWTAAGFKAMTGATVLAIAITVGRWALGRRQAGQRPSTPQRSAGAPPRRRSP